MWLKCIFPIFKILYVYEEIAILSIYFLTFFFSRTSTYSHTIYNMYKYNVYYAFNYFLFEMYVIYTKCQQPYSKIYIV